MSTPACIVIASSCVPSETAVPPSAPPCVDGTIQSLGNSPATTELVPNTLPDSTTVAVRTLLNPASEAAAVPCPLSPCAESNSASLDPASAPTAPSLSPAHLDLYPFLAIAMATASDIQRTPYLNYFFTGKQSPTLPIPLATANYPASPLLKIFAELG